MTPPVIGLVGLAGAGKDSVARALFGVAGYHRISFADPLYAGLHAMFGLDVATMTRAEKEAEVGWIGASPRRLLQTLGTEWGRDLVAHDLWLRVARRRMDDIRATKGPEVRFVVPDVRFANEADAILDMQGQLWRIERPQHTGLAGDAGAHVSEHLATHLPCDLTLVNDSDLVGLMRAVSAALWAFHAPGDLVRVAASDVQSFYRPIPTY